MTAPTPIGAVGTMAGQIAGIARTAPHAPAILAPGFAALDFGALARQMSAAAEALAGFGFSKGSRIALALPNGPHATVALLSVLGCATCVPLNPAVDEATLRSVCRRLRVDAIVVTGEASQQFHAIAADLGVAMIVLSESLPDAAGVFVLACASPRTPVPCRATEPEDIALVLATSGTTGQPKVVPLTQRNQFESARSRMLGFCLTPRDRALCVTPLFTASAIRRTLLPTLAAGGSVVCPREFDAERILDWFVEFAPTFYAAGPAVHRAVLEAMERRGVVPRHTLRFVFTSTTAMPPELHTRFEDSLGVPLIQTYATTEAGTIAQNPLPPGERRFGSVGLPHSAEVAIVGDDGRRVGSGESGEIVVRGPLLFGGYEDDPEANRQAFVGDWFRTGDLGYADSDGYLYLCGRLKETINRGGFKVAPAEVDAALLRHPDVIDAATFGISHPSLGEDVIAAVVLRQGAETTLQDVRDFAFTRLAQFKMPTRLVAVSAIPKGASGKVRRHTLADQLGIPARPPHVSPKDERQSIVAALFAEVLGAVDVGGLDNFFVLGGDSLRAAQLVARVNARFGCMLSGASLFLRPTVAEFAAEIDGACATGQRLAPPPITPLPRACDEAAMKAPT